MGPNANRRECEPKRKKITVMLKKVLRRKDGCKNSEIEELKKCACGGLESVFAAARSKISYF
jgi:hypothetical protein